MLLERRAVGVFIEANEDVFTHAAMGARRLPVLPSMALSASSDALLPPANSITFLPLETTMVFALANNAAASSRCSLRLAGTVSEISILLASKNLDARVQLVHPPRK